MQVNDSAANAPSEILKWVKRFQSAHDCPMILSRETSGYHLYLPCPECLETHGKRELQDPKYSINLSMLAGLGDEFRDNTNNGWMPADIHARDSLEKRREYGSGICMRTRSSSTPHRIPISELLHMGTVTERFPDIMTKASVSGAVGSAEREEMWEEDPVSGGLCPPLAGDLIPLCDLPPDHPAVEYMVGRGFQPARLQEQFRLSFCRKEYPVGQKGIFYRRMPGGWMDTPQHRIIFHSLIDGIPMTWQGRLIEKVSDDLLNRFMLHPYAGGFYPTADTGRALSSCRSAGYEGQYQVVVDDRAHGCWVFLWSHTHTRANPSSPWQPVPPFDEVRDGVLMFQPSKYRTAKYSKRHLMGWDAAVKRAESDPPGMRWCVLLEGPLDAARTGPGGIPLIGSSISEENAAKIATNFNLVLLGLDADKAGMEAATKVTKMLRSAKCRAPILLEVFPLPIPPGKDVGDLTEDEYDRILNKTLARCRRQLG